MGSTTVGTTATKAHSRTAVSVPGACGWPTAYGQTPPLGFKGNAPWGISRLWELVRVDQVELRRLSGGGFWAQSQL